MLWRFPFFVCGYFGVGQAGVVIHGIVQVGVAGPGPAVLPAFGASQ